MKILYDSKNKTIRELKEGSKAHKMSRLEHEIFIHLIDNNYVNPVTMMRITHCDNFSRLQYNMKKLKKRLTITQEKYVGSKLEDDIWII